MGMKFRCERDVLDRAFSIARRAVSGRGASLQVLSGLHLHLVGDELTVTGSDLDLTIRVAATVGGDGDGAHGGVCGGAVERGDEARDHVR